MQLPRAMGRLGERTMLQYCLYVYWDRRLHRDLDLTHQEGDRRRRDPFTRNWLALDWMISSRKALEERIPLTYRVASITSHQVQSRSQEWRDENTGRLTPIEHTTRHAFQPKVHHRTIARHLGSPKHVHHVRTLRSHGEEFSHHWVHVLVPTTTQRSDHR